MNTGEYDGIEYHADRMGGTRHAAINVKIYARINLPDGLEDLGEAAWESVRERFWEDAIELAHERGYSCAFAEGRSGGWMVPFYQTLSGAEATARNVRFDKRTGAHLFMHWAGQGPALGYPSYPDMDDLGERSRFRAFERRIRAMLDGVPAAVIDEARSMAEDELYREAAAI